MLNCCTCYVPCPPNRPNCICFKEVTCQDYGKLYNACSCFKSGHNCTKVNFCSNLAKCCNNTCRL
ncbi:hypothetical protein WN943_019118 [Citrus x changshan-huyou]